MDRVCLHTLRLCLRSRSGDPDNGVAPGTKWKDVPSDWECPVCGAGKDDFEKEE